MEFGSQGQPGDRETGKDAEASHSSEKLRTENCRQGWRESLLISVSLASRHTAKHIVGSQVGKRKDGSTMLFSTSYSPSSGLGLVLPQGSTTG